jgi:hypothetical protein
MRLFSRLLSLKRAKPDVLLSIALEIGYLCAYDNKVGPHTDPTPAQGAPMPPSLDTYDRRILFELDCDSRRPLSELSRRVRLGRDLVISRLERMHSSGVLRGCSALINPYKLGYTIYKTYLKLEANRERWSKLVAFLNAHPNTFWLA